jgi:hypothetical protein
MAEHTRTSYDRLYANEQQSTNFASVQTPPNLKLPDNTDHAYPRHYACSIPAYLASQCIHMYRTCKILSEFTACHLWRN